MKANEGGGRKTAAKARLLLRRMCFEFTRLSFFFSTSSSPSKKSQPSLLHRPQVPIQQRRHHAALLHHPDPRRELQQHIGALHRQQAGADLVARAGSEEATSWILLLLLPFSFVSFSSSSFPFFFLFLFLLLPPNGRPRVLGPRRIGGGVPVQDDTEAPRQRAGEAGELAEDRRDDEGESDRRRGGIAREALVFGG